MEFDPWDESPVEAERRLSSDYHQDEKPDTEVRMGWLMFDYPDPELVADVVRFHKFYESVAAHLARSRELNEG